MSTELFSIGHTSHLFNQILHVLRNEGSLDHNTAPWELRVVYEDEKIYILGMIDNATRTYNYLLVALKLGTSQSRLVATKPIFGLPLRQDRSDDWTLVFEAESAEQHPIHYRPGKWEEYIASFTESYKRRLHMARHLNHRPVDDAALFASEE